MADRRERSDSRDRNADYRRGGGDYRDGGGSRDYRDSGRDYRDGGGSRDYRESGGSRDYRDGGKKFGSGEEMPASLLVRNVSYRVRPDEIRRIFSRYGDVRDVYIPEDFYTKRPRGFAFVEFYDRRDAADAIDNLERYLVDGRELSIVFAKDRRKSADEMRPSRGSYEGRGGNRDRHSDDRGRRNSRDRSPSRSRSRSRDRKGSIDEEPTNRSARDHSKSVSPDRSKGRSRSASAS